MSTVADICGVILPTDAHNNTWKGMRQVVALSSVIKALCRVVGRQHSRRSKNFKGQHPTLHGGFLSLEGGGVS